MAARSVVTTGGEAVDQIALSAYGASVGTTEVLLNANPGLAAYGPLLPAGVTIDLPDLPAAPSAAAPVKLYD